MSLDWNKLPTPGEVARSDGEGLLVALQRLWLMAMQFTNHCPLFTDHYLAKR